MRALRDSAIEKELQSTLDKGHKVWVIGDVHGFSVTLRQMIETLNLSSEDRVVLLGDLIDRGPDSFDVIRCAREDHRIFCVKGNHESMMAANFTMEKIDHPDQDAIAWYHNGGRETVASYFRAFPEDAQGGALQWMMKEDIDWMTELPAHIVLDRWRLVHAGYNPDCGTEEQTEEDLLWIRSAFYRNTQPIDSGRTVVFGHTPTMVLYPRSEDRWGEVWFADVELEDGRSASIGIDTCVFHISDHPAVLTALDLQTLEMRSLNRCEPWEEDDRIRARFMH